MNQAIEILARVRRVTAKMSGSADRTWRYVLGLAEGDYPNLRRRMIQAGVDEDLADRYLREMVQHGADARDHYRAYMESLSQYRQQVHQALGEAENPRDSRGRRSPSGRLEARW